ncbi:MAG: DUF2784 domain-containing protein [Nitrospiraceae bacterium]|nr:MAG: DUF2784 domain-containing protein [Nitrospiraceae bacterium]
MDRSSFYLIAADSVVLLHLIWILFLILGALWGRRNRLVKGIHVAGICFAVFIQVAGRSCPFTHLEVWLRSKADPSGGYAGSFISHYAERLVYIDLPAPVILTLTILLALMCAWIYFRGRGRG